MNRIPRLAGIVALLFLLGSSPETFQTMPARDFDARLAAALDEGRIDRAHAALYRLFAVKAPERLPAEFRGDQPGGEVARFGEGAAQPRIARCGTTVVRGLRDDLSALPPAERAEAEALLTPRANAARQTQRVGAKIVTHELPSWIITENFSIEWGPDLTDVDGSNKGHPTDADADRVPDVVEEWARYFEASYQAEVIDRGYTRAALATRLIPVYIGNSAPGTTIDTIASGTYAITNDLPLYVVVNNDFRFVPANDDPEGRIPGAMKVTAAHEFFHVLQFLLPLPGAWSPTNDDWWLEASATWMEEEVFDQVNDYYQYFRGVGGWAGLAATGLAVSSDSGDYTTKAYGNVIFAKYLSEHVGGARSMAAVWDLIEGGHRILFDGTAGPGVANGALTRFAVQKGFSGVAELDLGFHAANATMDYREGIHYGSSPLQASSLTAQARQPSVPRYLGAHYLQAGGSGGGVTVGLAGDPQTAWGLAFSLRHPDGHAVVLGAVDDVGSPSLALASFEADATLFAISSYLTPRLPAASGPPPPNGYATTATFSGPGADAPGPVEALTAAPTHGGLNVSWLAPTSGGAAAGYVARWKKTAAATEYATRTVFGPVKTLELRGLDGGVPYDVEVFAYGSAGEEGPTSSPVSASPSPSSPTPTPEITPVEIHVPGGGRGGGGGGGCFVQVLGL